MSIAAAISAIGRVKTTIGAIIIYALVAGYIVRVEAAPTRDPTPRINSRPTRFKSTASLTRYFRWKFQFGPGIGDMVTSSLNEAGHESFMSSPHLFINGHYVSPDPGQLQHLSDEVNTKAPARNAWGLDGCVSKILGDARIGVFSSLPDKKKVNAQPASSYGAWYPESSEVGSLEDTECYRSLIEFVEQTLHHARLPNEGRLTPSADGHYAHLGSPMEGRHTPTLPDFTQHSNELGD